VVATQIGGPLGHVAQARVERPLERVVDVLIAPRTERVARPVLHEVLLRNHLDGLVLRVADAVQLFHHESRAVVGDVSVAGFDVSQTHFVHAVVSDSSVHVRVDRGREQHGCLCRLVGVLAHNFGEDQVRQQRVQVPLLLRLGEHLGHALVVLLQGGHFLQLVPDHPVDRLVQSVRRANALDELLLRYRGVVEGLQLGVQVRVRLQRDKVTGPRAVEHRQPLRDRQRVLGVTARKSPHRSRDRGSGSGAGGRSGHGGPPREPRR